MKCLFAGFATIDTIHNKKYPGGAAGSLSLNATRLGIESHLLTVLAEDERGNWYRNILEKNGVVFPYSITNAPSIPTCVIPPDIQEGSQRIWNDNGALVFFDQLQPSQEYLDAFDLIFVVNAPPKLIQILATHISQRTIIYIPGPQVVLQPNYIQPILFEKTKILFANEEEWTIIKKYRPFDAGLSLIVTTKASKGGQILRKNHASILFEAQPMINVVDTTGAGDNFALGFSLSYEKDQDILKAIENGKQLSSSIITQYGNARADVVV